MWQIISLKLQTNFYVGPIVSEVMEIYIYNNVFKVVEPIINTNQHGFMNEKSCTTELLTVYDEIGKHLDEGKLTDMIFLDFLKTFDSVNHNMLIHKLHKLGFSGKLLLWISDYLKDRSQQVVPCAPIDTNLIIRNNIEVGRGAIRSWVVLDGVSSEFVPVTSCVPQGSILGSLLFLRFINDMPDCAEHSILSLFADDVKCFRTSNVDNCERLQHDLNSLYEWSQVLKLNFNVNKCKVIYFTIN